MTKYKLHYLPLFVDDLLEISCYIKETLKAPLAAESFINDVEKAIKNRLKSPLGFEPYKGGKERPLDYYRIYVRNYTIFYVVYDNIMEVRRIVYSKRNLEEEI
jgi:plasmid stabilization system protein ParE